MIDKGASPYVVTYSGKIQLERRNLGYLKNLPTQKSIYFTTQPCFGEYKDRTDFPDPWLYNIGVFDGRFKSMIGQGASGTVLSGEWYGAKAAFKFVDIGNQNYSGKASLGMKELNQKLSEMKSFQVTKGSKIVSFYGHYR